MTSALSMKGVVKRYRGFTLGPLDLELEPGTVLALIGANGAGKTTTVNTVIGLVKHDAGSIRVFDQPANPDQAGWKREIGFVGDSPAFYEYWSGEKNLKFVSQFYPTWDDELMRSLTKRFELDLKKRVNLLSRGNRMKLALIGALAHRPRLLLLDEPTSGLDPIVRTEFLDSLWELMEKGDAAVLYSTHVLADIARLSDELAFIEDGKIVLRECKDDLLDRWRRISFRYPGQIPKLKECVSQKQDGVEHLVVSSNHQVTLAGIGQLGAGDVEEAMMTIDEIAVQILREVGNVAADKG
jgi:ABC-2 type transport system ATP-binding protein